MEVPLEESLKMVTKLLRQIHVLQICILALFLSTVFLCINCFHPLLPQQEFKVIDAERINIREENGRLKSNSAGFNVGQRAKQGPVRLSGLMFYNEEGEETGGLVYFGKAIPGGQDSDVTLTMDQFRNDQNVYLHHEEFKDTQGLRIEDGLAISAHPDWANAKVEYETYAELEKLTPELRDELQLKSLQAGKMAHAACSSACSGASRTASRMMMPAFSSRTSGVAPPSSSTSTTTTSLTSRSMTHWASLSSTS